jgi:hypothetical protein
MTASLNRTILFQTGIKLILSLLHAYNLQDPVDDVFVNDSLLEMILPRLNC